MKTKGFTLIEVMIVVTIIGILAAIVYPSYQETVRDARRADGRTALLELQSKMERFRGNCPFYPQSIGAADSCGVSASATTIKADSATEQDFYTLSIVASSASSSSYTLRATPKGAQSGDSCSQMDLKVSNADPKGERTGAGTKCWKK